MMTRLEGTSQRPNVRVVALEAKGPTSVVPTRTGSDTNLVGAINDR